MHTHTNTLTHTKNMYTYTNKFKNNANKKYSGENQIPGDNLLAL